MKKRITAWILAAVMILSALPLTALAEEGLADGWYSADFVKTGSGRHSGVGDAFFEVTLFHVCDANDDGRIDITDVTALLAALTDGASTEADPDGDGALAIGDVTALLNYLASH